MAALLVALLVAGVLCAVLSVASIAWMGFLIMTIWNWFMPVIFGLPILNIWQALALSVVISIFRLRAPTDAELEAQEACGNKHGATKFFAYMIGSLIVLLVAYVVHCNMPV